MIIGILIASAINQQSKNKNNLALRDLYIIQLNDEADRNLKELTVIETYYENFLMPNVRFRYMGNATENYLKDVYFENMVLSRMATITQNRDAYANSIESLIKLKNTFTALRNTN